MKSLMKQIKIAKIVLMVVSLAALFLPFQNFSKKMGIELIIKAVKHGEIIAALYIVVPVLLLAAAIVNVVIKRSILAVAITETTIATLMTFMLVDEVTGLFGSRGPGILICLFSIIVYAGFSATCIYDAARNGGSDKNEYDYRPGKTYYTGLKDDDYTDEDDPFDYVPPMPVVDEPDQVYVDPELLENDVEVFFKAPGSLEYTEYVGKREVVPVFNNGYYSQRRESKLKINGLNMG